MPKLHDPLLFHRAPQARPLPGDYRQPRSAREALLYVTLTVLVGLALCLLGCATQRPRDLRPYRPANYRSQPLRLDDRAELRSAQRWQSPSLEKHY